MVFIAWLMVSLLLVGVGAQSQAVSYAPEDCLEVMFAGCYGMQMESMQETVPGSLEQLPTTTL